MSLSRSARFGRYCLLLLAALLSLFGLARPAAAADWEKNFGLAGSNVQINATAVDSAGNTYIAGTFSGATLTLGATTLTRIGNPDTFAAKLDAGGTLLWAKNYGGSGASTMANALAVDASGNVYLGGYFLGANLTTPALTKIGTYDAFALKLDAGGTVLWAKNYGGSGAYAQANAIAVDASGNVYLGGNFDANLSTPALTKIGIVDAFALKLDASGTVLWAQSYGGSGASTMANALAIDTSGNVYLGGYFQTANLTTPALTKIGTYDAFALKLDAGGATTWAKNYGGSGANAYGNAIAVDASGNVYLGGYFLSANLTTPALTKIGDRDAFALKLDTGGATTWVKNYGGSWAVAWATALAVDASGNVYLGGYFQTANLTTPALTKIGTLDAFLIKRTTLPTATGISPASGSVLGGTTVTLTGGDFSGASAVNFGANPGTALTVNSDTSITVTAPAGTTGAGAVDVTVTTPSGTGGTGNGLFTYLPAAPEQPAAPTVTLAGNIATVSFTAPAANGSAITGYTVSTSPAGGVDLEAGSTATTHHVVGLAAGTAYSFSVVAANTIGSSSASSAAGASTPASYAGESFGSLSANTQITATAVDGSGNTYIAGYFTGATLTLGATTLTRIGNQDAFAAKLDAGGTVLWAKNYGGSGATAWATALAVDGSGNVYLGGNFFDANLSTPALTMIGNQDAFALKLDAGGATTWAKNYGGSGAFAQANALAVDALGNVYLGGNINGNLSTPALTNLGTQDAFALKLDAGGNTTWARNYGGSGAYAGANAIAVDASGNVYLGGTFFNANLSTPALTLIGIVDAFALKLDAGGATTWAKNYGGSGANTLAFPLAVDASGNVYLGGYFFNANLTTPALTKIGGQDAFALKLDAGGATTWAKNYGGSGAGAYGNALAVDASGNVYLGGYFSGANLSTPALTLLGTQDALLIKQATPPAQPVVSASGGNAQATLSFITPAANGAALTGYTVVATPAGASPVTLTLSGATATTSVTAGGLTATITGVTGGSTVITVSGLTNGTAYAFTVAATNSAGSGRASSSQSATAVAPAPVYNYDPPPTVINAPAGTPTTLSGTTPVTAAAGSTLVIPVGANVVGAPITLPAPSGAAKPEPVTIKIGGQTFTVTPTGGGTVVTLKKVMVNGVEIPVLAVTSGSVTVSAPAGQPLLVLSNGVIVIAGDNGGTVTANGNTLAVSNGTIVLPSNAFAASNGFASIQDGKLYAGEVADLDAAGKITGVRLGSLAKDGSALGDPIQPASAANLEDLAIVPNLKGKIARLSATQDYTDRLAASIGKEVTSQGQGSDGLLRLTLPGGTLNALPVGRLTVDTSRADGVTLTANGHAEIVQGGVVASFAPAVGDFAQFAASLAQLDTNAVVAVQEDGRVQVRFKGVTHPLQPAWTATADQAGPAGLSVDEQGMIVYRDGAGNRQVLYPAFADLPRLTAVFKVLDADVSVTGNGDGSATARFLGKTYTLQPDYRLTTAPADQTGRDWWQDKDGKVVLRNGDGSAQGFTVR